MCLVCSFALASSGASRREREREEKELLKSWPENLKRIGERIQWHPKKSSSWRSVRVPFSPLCLFLFLSLPPFFFVSFRATNAECVRVQIDDWMLLLLLLLLLSGWMDGGWMDSRSLLYSVLYITATAVAGWTGYVLRPGQYETRDRIRSPNRVWRRRLQVDSILNLTLFFLLKLLCWENAAGVNWRRKELFKYKTEEAMVNVLCIASCSQSSPIIFKMVLFSASYDVCMYDAVQCCVAYSQCTRCWYYKPTRSFFLSSFPFPMFSVAVECTSSSVVGWPYLLEWRKTN